MPEDSSRACIECRGAMAPIVMIDKIHMGIPQMLLEYRQPDDSPSFWSKIYPKVGTVRAFMCGECGRIALYGEAADA